jgi:predicted RNA-binding Zn-ribbon protein involved in translation (DUF1610 family)
MVLSIACEGCQKPLRIREEFAGKRVRCPACGHVQVAAAPEQPAPVAETPLPPPPPPQLELDEPEGEEIEDVLLAPGQEDIPLTPPPDEPRASRRPRRRRPREEEDDEVAEVYCPHCGKLILADEERCSRCGEVLDDEEVEEMVEGLKKERAFQNGMSFLFGVPGLLLGFVAAFMIINSERGDSAVVALLALGLGFVGLVLLFLGLGFAAMYKGLNPAWALLGLLHLIGFIILAVLPDTKGRRLLRLRNFLRERRALGF